MMAQNQIFGFPFHTSQMDISKSKVLINGVLTDLDQAIGEVATEDRIVINDTDNAIDLSSYDGSVNFKVGDRDGAVNYLSVEGNVASGGPVLFAAGTSTNIDINYASKGTGGHVFGNALGVIVEFADTGDNAELTSNFTFMGGDATNPPRLSSDADAQFEVDTGYAHIFKVSGYTAFKARNAGSGTPTTWITASCDASTPRLMFEGSSSDVGGYLQAKGTAGLIVLNSQASLFTIAQDGSNNVKHGLVVRPSTTGVAVEMYAAKTAFDGSGDTAPPLRLSTKNTGGRVDLWATTAATGLQMQDDGTLILPRLSADPATPADWVVWVNTTSGKVRFRNAVTGTTQDLN